MQAITRALTVGGLLLAQPLAPVFAFDDEQETGWFFGAMAGVQYEEALFKQTRKESDAALFPIVGYAGNGWSISTLGIEIDAYSAESGDWGVDISASLAPGFGGSRDEDDARIFAGMDKREDPTEVILTTDFTTPVGLISLELANDIGEAYEGGRASIQYGIPLYASDNALFMVGAGAEFFSDKYVDYYYGVRASEVTAERAAYRGTAARSEFVGYSFEYRLSKNWSISHELNYRRVPDEIRRSSLTEDKDSQLSSGLFISYEF